MTDQDHDKHQAKILSIRDRAAKRNALPYLIELWREEASDQAERVLARAVSATLARAIFKAALNEHPNRRITLRRGSRVIADSRRD